ncbi:hypothetical protein L210DRAFT_3073903 [Boletus edulis BED1]|uniref:BTB domain-containing protein n=1 Tax=Boletus edulis BED1 TaxID=1328754 RepID=A0AAD4BH47_BOLED|nr:hypothetical protein L210DRAFT_3073903 [Boletus edulis BED1]
MRVFPDPLTCSTGRFLPSLNVPKALIQSDIWFLDGNVVLVAGSAAFKVHRGQLERHSEVFKDMFLVGRAGVRPSRQGTSLSDKETLNEEGNKMVEGCPTVDIYDCPSDVHHLLVALYDGFYFPKPHARDFSALSSVLRLSTKYFIEHLRAQCLARLVHDWPTTLADWDRREAAATDVNGRYTPRDAYAHPVLAINLALELGIPEVLPSAFYDLSRYGPSRILAGARAPPPVFAAPDPCASRSVEDATGAIRRLQIPGQPQGDGDKSPMIHPSHDSLVRTLRGRELAQLYISTFLARALEQHPSAACLYSTRAAAASSGGVGVHPGGTSTSTSTSASTSTTASASTSTSASASRSAHCTESFYFIHLNVLRSVGGIACGRDADPLYTLVQAAEMVERRDFSDGVRTCGLKMCGVCKREWKGEVGRAREEVWGLIPVWFGLRDGGVVEHGTASVGEMDEDLGDEEMLEDGEDVDVDIDVDELEE